MSVREPPDWAGFRQAVAARQRLIMEGLAEFLRLDTVSQKPDRVRTGAEWLRQVMRARGLDAHVLETGGNPAVYGALPVPGAERTLLIYCHYDVKPAPPDGWLQTSPFEPVLRARALKRARRCYGSATSPTKPCPTIGSTAAAPPTTRGLSGHTSLRSS